MNSFIPSALYEGTTTIYQVLNCSFNQSFYCLVCCSTDPTAPPHPHVYNISSIRGTEVTVDLDGLTSGQTYYCKAAATNTNSSSCVGSMIGDVKMVFSFITAPGITAWSSPPTSGTCIVKLHGNVQRVHVYPVIFKHEHIMFHMFSIRLMTCFITTNPFYMHGATLFTLCIHTLKICASKHLIYITYI